MAKIEEEKNEDIAGRKFVCSLVFYGGKVE